jgi:hypothetical protein
MRTTRGSGQTQHLTNSREVFLRLVDVARGMDKEKIEAFRSEREYEGLERYILLHLLGR